jgi:hypothetical protein
LLPVNTAALLHHCFFTAKHLFISTSYISICPMILYKESFSGWSLAPCVSSSGSFGQIQKFERFRAYLI